MQVHDVMFLNIYRFPMSNRPRNGENMKQEPCETAASQQWLAAGAGTQKWPASIKLNYYPYTPLNHSHHPKNASGPTPANNLLGPNPTPIHMKQLNSNREKQF